MYSKTTCPSPVGELTLASDGKALVGLWLAGQKYYGGTVRETMAESDEVPVFAAVKNWLNRYFAGEKPAIGEIPLAPAGGPFRQSVWKLLCAIPYGETTTYGELAKKLAMPKMSARAVGGAVGHNPISILIPCHRVVGANGSLTGYAGGVDQKAWLLVHEGAAPERFTVPSKGTAR